MFSTRKSLIFLNVILILLLGGVAYLYFRNLSNIKEQLAIQQQMYNQSQKAYLDNKNELADSLQILADNLSNLNSINKDLKRQINIYSSNTQILIDSIQAQGSALTNLSSDSAGNKYAEVLFKGVQGVFNYNGWTKYFITLSKSTYGISINTLPINLTDVLYYDFSDKILKSRIITTTPGVKIFVHGEIDSSVYSGLINTVTEVKLEQVGIFPSFGLQLKANLGIGSTVLQTNHFNNIVFDGSAMLYYKWLNITWYPFDKTLSAGVFYNLDLGKTLNTIF